MTEPSEIGWGEYKTKTDAWEGPFFRGKVGYALPAQPDFLDKCLSVVTATEGGHVDAVNAYDRCIISVGLIQLCEAAPIFGVSNLLGRCAELDGFMFDSMVKKFPITIEFKKNSVGKWRFFLKGQEITSQIQQRQLFLGAPTVGLKGTWTPEAKDYAKRVAAWMANVWGYTLFRVTQAGYMKLRLDGFVLPEVKTLLFSNTMPSAQFSWTGALRAAYYSFAANLPSVAASSIKSAASTDAWSSANEEERFRLGLQALTFSPGIGIYPARYEAIAPVLKRLFGIDLPLKAADLKAWEGEAPEPISVSEEELEAASRLAKLHDGVAQGLEGLDALDALMRKDS